MTDGPTMIEHAHQYGEWGLRVFPIKGKRPLIAEWPTVASTDADYIERWWGVEHPDAGIGLACGDRLAEHRYLFVLDLDEHDPAASGAEALAELEHAHGDLPDTPCVHTPTGGRHIYLTAPYPVTNARGTLPAGIDVRGRGGYVVLPPSQHPAGGVYTHDVEHELGDTKIAAAPDWLLDILKPEETTPQAPPRAASEWDALDDRPGTEWARNTPWSALLEPDGWRHLRTTADGTEEWERPGQPEKGKTGATVNYGGADRLVVHSTSANVPAGAYSKLGYLAEAHHGGDFSAAAKSVAPERPGAVIAADMFQQPPEGDGWEVPQPLTASHTPPPFPIDVFPDWVRDQVEQVSAEMQLAPDLAAMLALGALSTIAGGRVRTRVEGRWTEPANLYLVVALPPGAGKSPVFRMMIEGPLGAFERELDEGGAAQRERDALFRKAAQKALEKAVNSGDREAIMSAQAELSEHPETKPPKLFVDDVTVEQLGVVMSEQAGRIALVSTEGGIFDQMAGRYGDGGGKANLDPYLMAWSGDTMRVDRVGRDELRIYDPALTVVVTVQPTVIEALAERPEYRGRGLTARFMYAYPTDTVGRRDLERASTYQPSIEAVYVENLTDLARTLRQHYDTEPMDLRLTPDAATLIRRLRAAHEPQMLIDGDLHDMREWVTKSQSSTVRVAALLHLAKRTGETEIDVDTVRAALAVEAYWVAHARRVHDLFSVDDDLSRAGRLVDFVRRHVEPGDTFTLRDITQWSRTGEFRKRDDCLKPLATLVEFGWLRPEFDGPLAPRPGVSFPFTLSPRCDDTQGSPRLTRTQALTESSDTVDAQRQGEPKSLMCLETQNSYLSLSTDIDTDENAQPKAHETHPDEDSIPCPL